MKQIILVDDDPGIQDATTILLERAGYEVLVYSNGEKILEGDFTPPDLFILDKQLSGVDGLDVCRCLKEHEQTKDIPIIMLSANPHISKLAMAAGADDFLEKPFKMTVLREMVAKYILTA